MNLNKTQTAVKTAYDKGYRVNKYGEVIGKKGKILSYKLNHGYKMFCVRLKNGETYAIHYHRLQAYQKFGNIIFKKDINVRHLNGDSLDNSFDNIDIGTCSDNMMDILPEVRSIKAINATRKKQDSIRSFEERCLIYEDLKNKIPYSEIMKKYSISSKGTLSFMKNKSLEYIEYLSK